MDIKNEKREEQQKIWKYITKRVKPQKVGKFILFTNNP